MKNIDGAAAAALVRNQQAADMGPVESANDMPPAAGLARPQEGADLGQLIADEMSNFFSRWDAELQGVDCVSDAILVELSEQRDTTRWPEHVMACSRCRSVISVLQRAGGIKNDLPSKDK